MCGDPQLQYHLAPIFLLLLTLSTSTLTAPLPDYLTTFYPSFTTSDWRPYVFPSSQLSSAAASLFGYRSHGLRHFVSAFQVRILRFNPIASHKPPRSIFLTTLTQSYSSWRQHELLPVSLRLTAADDFSDTQTLYLFTNIPITFLRHNSSPFRNYSCSSTLPFPPSSRAVSHLFLGSHSLVYE